MDQRTELTDLIIQELEKKEDGFGAILDRGKTAIEQMLVKSVNPDLIERSISHMKHAYMHMSPEERDDFEKQVNADLILPNYNHFITRSVYFLLKSYGKGTFQKLKITGAKEMVLEQAQKGKLILLPTHTDMLDTVFSAYLFLENNMKPPSFHAGINLDNAFGKYLLPRFNALFIKRKSLANSDLMMYAMTIEYQLRQGENLSIYPEATRTRSGLIAPVKSKRRFLITGDKLVKGMAKGWLSAVLRANMSIGDVYFATCSVTSGIIPDMSKDLEGVASKFDVVTRFFSSIRSYMLSPSQIYIHYNDPVRLPQIDNSRKNVLEYTNIIREGLRNSITVLPENLLAYTMKFISLSRPDYEDMNKKDRYRHLSSTYNKFRAHIMGSGVNYASELEDVFLDPAIEFYQKLGLMTEGFSMRIRSLVEYNANRIQHFLKEFPLPKK